MSTNKITVGAIGLLIAAGAASVAIQEVSNERLAARITELQNQAGQFDSLSQTNTSLAKSLHEVRSMQNAALGADAVAARLASLQSGYAALNREVERRRSNSSEGGASPSNAVDPSKLDRVPSPVAMARPIYPAELRAKGVGGQVVVDFVVDKSGNVQDAYAVSSTQPEFEQPAIDAVSQWQFKPGSKGATPVDTRMEIPIVFSPGNSPVASPDAGPSSPTDWFTNGQGVTMDGTGMGTH
jgi:protein TonB